MTELFDAADYTVILAYQKMQDDAADEKGFRSIRARLALRLLRSRCRKAAARQPKFDENVRQCLSQLAAVEERGSASLDEAADCFARLMAFPADRLADEMQRRLQSEILYHVGRAVYILDAVDDYSDDRKNGRYNPLCLRFGSEVMTAKEKAEIRATLNLSLSRAMSARRSCRRARGRPSSKTSYPAVFRMLPMRCLPEHGRKTEKIRRISDPSDRE